MNKLEWLMVLMVWSGFSFFCGVLDMHRQDGKVGCTYDSLGSRINIGYIVGCELSRPRFRVIKN